MAKRFFTADWHLNSEGTRQIYNRPFKTVGRMNDRLIAAANNRAKDRSDLIVHVGDFCQRGNDNHYDSEELRCGTKTKPSTFVDSITATFVNIEGNHDKSNGVLSIGRGIVMQIGRFNDASVGHYPSWYDEAKGTFISHSGMGDWTIRVCGHVHGRWKHRIDFVNNILNVNVGVDVWRYNIVSEVELMGYVGHIADGVTEEIANYHRRHSKSTRSWKEEGRW